MRRHIHRLQLISLPRGRRGRQAGETPPFALRQAQLQRLLVLDPSKALRLLVASGVQLLGQVISCAIIGHRLRAVVEPQLLNAPRHQLDLRGALDRQRVLLTYAELFEVVTTAERVLVDESQVRHGAVTERVVQLAQESGRGKLRKARRSQKLRHVIDPIDLSRLERAAALCEEHHCNDAEAPPREHFVTARPGPQRALGEVFGYSPTRFSFLKTKVQYNVAQSERGLANTALIT